MYCFYNRFLYAMIAQGQLAIASTQSVPYSGEEISKKIQQKNLDILGTAQKS